MSNLDKNPDGQPKTIPPLHEILRTFNYKGVPISCMLTSHDMDAIQELEIRGDDVILASYPKCGTHWMLEILQIIRNDASPIPIEDRLNVTALEIPLRQDAFRLGYTVLKDRPSPRLYVTHLPIQLLPSQIWKKKPKIVYVCRNPKDCAASIYNFFAGNKGAPNWNDTFDQFISGEGLYGSFWSHILGFWKHRNDDNVFFVRYEELKKNTTYVIAKVAKHINRPLSTDGIENVAKHSTIEAMKTAYEKAEKELGPNGKFITKACGRFPFIKEGKVGGWKTLFTVAQNERLEEVHREEMKDSGLEFEFKV